MSSHDETPWMEVIDTWFGPPGPDGVRPGRRDLWWSATPAMDADLRERFEARVAAAARGDLDAWTRTPRGRLALVLLLDQMPRNIYRKTAQAFAFDARARAIVHAGIAAGAPWDLTQSEATFFYMPLMHSEDLADHDTALRVFTELRDAAPPDARASAEETLQFAARHHAIIARFGRYPYRNEVLGRTPTPEEELWLAEGGPSFGQ